MDLSMTADDDDDHIRYFSDIVARKDELRRLNEELDKKLILAEKENVAVPSISSTIKDSANSKAFTISTPTNRDYNKNDSFDWEESCSVRDVDPSINQPEKDCKSSIDQVDKKSSKIARKLSTTAKIKKSRPALLNNNENDDSEVCLTEESNCKEISTDVARRIQQARIKALGQQLKEALNSKSEAEKMVVQLQVKLKDEQGQKKNLERIVTSSSHHAKSKTADAAAGGKNVESLKLELSIVKRELASAQKTIHDTELEHKGSELRLCRALEEVEKYKKKVSRSVLEKKDNNVDSRAERDVLLKQTKTLERQRNELLNAFQQQLKLIDILKRQKVHAEAAKLLSFTEEEYLKTLDWNV